MDRIILGCDGSTPTRIQTDSAGRLYAVPGFESVVAGVKSNASAAAGSNTLASDAVPAGKAWVITHLAAFNDDNSVSGIRFQVVHDGNTIPVRYVGSVAADVTAEWTGELYLDPSDTVQVILDGCTLDDDIYFSYFGYQIEEP